MMKVRILMTAISCLFLIPPAVPAQVVEWIGPTEHNFGFTAYQQKVSHNFYFRNISTEPIIADNVRGSCGCTAPQWPEQPILPGDTSYISVEYDGRKKAYYSGLVKVYFSGQRKAERLTINAEGEEEP